MFETIIRALVEMIDSVMSIFSLGHSAEKRLSESSHVGESRLDREARSWQAKIIRSWYFVVLLIVLLIGGVGAAILKFFFAE